MKYLDRVRIINDKPEYLKNGISKGMEGTIIMPEIRNNQFEIEIHNKSHDMPLYLIKIEDLELVKANDRVTDKDVLDDLPLKNPKWWCKVENGFIINLLGEKKNKIPYDYNS